MERVTIKNICHAKISLYAPEVKIDRELLPGQSFKLEKERYEDLMLDQGFEALLQGHYINVEGLEEDEKPALNNEAVYEASDISKMLDELDVSAFAKFIPTAAPAERDTVVELAVEKKVTHAGFVALIKKYCGRDILELINMKHQEEI